MPFGGAGPLHAAALADAARHRARALPARLRRAVRARPRRRRAAPRRLAHRDAARRASSPAVAPRASASAAARRRRARALGEPPVRARVRHELRYRGQSFELPVDEELAAPASAAPARRWAPSELREAFAEAHEQRYGYRDERAEVELVNDARLRVGRRARAAPAAPPAAPAARPGPHELVLGGERVARGPAAAASSRPAARCAAPRCARCPRPRCSCPPAGPARSTSTARSTCERQRVSGSTRSSCRS